MGWTTLWATIRYDFHMQVRKRSVWIVTLLLSALEVLIDLPTNLPGDLTHHGPQIAEGNLALMITGVLPLGFGCLLADRLVRDRVLHLTDLFRATPAPPDARLCGKFVGAAAATAVPIALAMLGGTIYVAVQHSDLTAILWGVAAFATVIVPGLLFVAAFALVGPLVMPIPLFRVLFVGYWFWGNAVPPSMMPTPAHGILTPIGGYAEAGFFGGHNSIAGWSGHATLAFLRPDVTMASAMVSIALLLAVAVLVLIVGNTVLNRYAESA